MHFAACSQGAPKRWARRKEESGSKLTLPTSLWHRQPPSAPISVSCESVARCPREAGEWVKPLSPTSQENAQVCRDHARHPQNGSHHSNVLGTHLGIGAAPSLLSSSSRVLEEGQKVISILIPQRSLPCKCGWQCVFPLPLLPQPFL